MIFDGIEICCPSCHGDLRLESPSNESLRCVRCGTSYPVTLGIPDLRVAADPYIDKDADRAKGLQVAERMDSLSFDELIDFYYSITSAVPPEHAQLYKRGLIAAAARSAATLASWSDTNPGFSTGTSLLEVGCGTGPLLVAASKCCSTVVGVDIAFRWLVVAKKRLSEANVHAPLVCACAEALPFPDRVFDHLAAESVVELVDDQPTTFDEFHRVLRPAGRLFIVTSNRFSLGPDPHTGIWAGSWLPNRLTASLVRRKGGIPPKRQFLTWLSLSRLVRRAAFRVLRISLPDVAEGHRSQFGPLMNAMVSLYHLVKRAYLLRGVLWWVGPQIHLVAVRDE